MKLQKFYAKGIPILLSVSLLIVLFSFLAFIEISSKTLKFSTNEKSRIGVSGFTNLNSWRMETNKITCDADFVILDGDLKEIKFLKFNTPVKSLISTHSHMDSIVYDMLITTETDLIKFEQSRAMILPRMKMVNIIGDLTLGNLTKKIDLQLSYTINNDQEISFKGLKKLNLHEFGISKLDPILKRVKFDDQVLVQIEMNLNTANKVSRKH